MYEFFLVDPGPRPPFRELAEYLWGAGCDFDSDGDSSANDARDWTELTATLRPSYAERIDIDPLEESAHLVLWIRSDREALAIKAAEFLAEWSGGELLRDRP